MLEGFRGLYNNGKSIGKLAAAGGLAAAVAGCSVATHPSKVYYGNVDGDNFRERIYFKDTGGSSFQKYALIIRDR